MGNSNRKPRYPGKFNHSGRFFLSVSSREDYRELLTSFLYENDNLFNRHHRKTPTSLGKSNYKNSIPLQNKAAEFSNRPTEGKEKEQPMEEKVISEYLYSFLPASWPKEWDILKDEDLCSCNCPCKTSTFHKSYNLQHLNNPDYGASLHGKSKLGWLINRKSKRL